MIKSSWLILPILLMLTSCGINRMNNNLEQSIQSVQQNTTIVQQSSEVIAKNTQEIARSSTTMTIYFPLFLVIILAILLYPTFLLIKLQRRLYADLQRILKRLH